MVHHEKSRFVRGEDNRWLCADSEMNPKGPQRRVEKIGRNDPCPCGSGKKYKKCCGA
jgi:SEC-C motif-containing protein